MSQQLADQGVQELVFRRQDWFKILNDKVLELLLEKVVPEQRRSDDRKDSNGDFFFAITGTLSQHRSTILDHSHEFLLVPEDQVVDCYLDEI